MAGHPREVGGDKSPYLLGEERQRANREKRRAGDSKDPQHHLAGR
jgi:hypothetical protein